MNAFRLAIKNLWYYRVTAVNSVVLFASGMMVLLIIEMVRYSAEKFLSGSAGNVDMVLCAKGSPLQAVLANVYHIDNPTGNVSRKAEMLLKNPMIRRFLPISYGDQVSGMRLLGTTSKVLDFYNLKLVRGRWCQSPFEVVVGQEEALAKGWDIGTELISSHGEVNGTSHTEKLRVIGLVASSASGITKRVIFTSLESVWLMHHSPPVEVTAYLVQFKSKMALLTIPATINKNTPYQAALPSIEINRLLFMAAGLFEAIDLLGIIIVSLALLTIVLGMMNSLRERKREWLLMRLMGASMRQVVWVMVLESLVQLVLAGLLAWGVALIAGLALPVALSDLGLDELSLPPHVWWAIPGLVLMAVVSVLPVWIKLRKLPITIEMKG